MGAASLEIFCLHCTLCWGAKVVEAKLSSISKESFKQTNIIGHVDFGVQVRVEIDLFQGFLNLFHYLFIVLILRLS